MTEEVEYTSLITSASPRDEVILPPHPNEKKRQLRSDMWNHFTMMEGDEKKAKCQYCGVLIKYSNGTSGMRTHLGRCTAYDHDKTQATQPNKRRKTTTEGQVGCSQIYSKFDQDACRAQLVKTFVCAEIPFRFVESEEFRKLIITLQPRFYIPSRSTMRRDIWALYLEEKEKLKKILPNCGRVSLTTDTWTSTQNLSYMSLTVHFVDSEWKMHKKIINFCQITGHSGHVIGKYVDDYLRSWGLSQVMTITVDNASANTTMIKYLNIRMRSWSNLVLNGDFVHMRCCAHILNLIVKSGLKEDKSCIRNIRHAVKYVKSSPSRLVTFMKCAVQEKVTYKGAVILDVETRWNSTYSMLKDALQYQKAFDLLYARDKTFREEMDKTNQVVKKEDWTYVASVLPLLEMFYKSTNRLSGSLYVTSASYMAEVFTIGKGINKHLKSNNEHIKNTASKMKGKFNKYWGDPDTLNILLLIAFVLDPRVKMSIAEFYIDLLYANTGKVDDLKKKVKSSLSKLYVQYRGFDDSQSSQIDTPPNEDDDDDIFCHYSQETGHKSDPMTEIESYLQEAWVPHLKAVEFDILGWWKANLTRYPILASIAREVLAIPASTVASESAFSTGGRVVSDYRTCLTPKMVEALVCTQDWLKGKSLSLFSEEDLDEIHQLEQEITSLTSANFDDDDEDLAS